MDLRKQLAEKTTLLEQLAMLPSQQPSQQPSTRIRSNPSAAAPVVGMGLPYSAAIDTAAAPHEGVAGSLLALRNSTDVSSDVIAVRGRQPVNSTFKTLGSIVLDSSAIYTLFEQFLHSYHPWLPILDPDKPPEHFYELSPLLFWTVIAVAARRYDADSTLLTGLNVPFCELVWSTISQVPQNYHVVKSLAILCMWPLPTKSTSTDQTFMLAGLMMQIALQTGLHRPAFAQDFSRGRLELQDEDIGDRLRTWAVCNIVAQK